MKLSDEQLAVIQAPLGAMAVTACAGSGKTATAIRRLIYIRQLMKSSRGRVALLSFSNVAVDTFNKGFQQLAINLPDGVNLKRVEVDTLDGFFTSHVIRPHAHRTMGANQAAFLVSGSEPFLSGFSYWRDGSFPLPIAEFKVGIADGKTFFYSGTGDNLELLDQAKALELVERLGRTGAYTHDLGRYWIYKTLSNQPAVLRALATRYPQILVDESQDLGMVHQEILELLIKEGVQVSLIGDANQGIYGFAGADGSFLRSYSAREGVSGFELTRNYRSLPPIIDLANALSGREDKPDREPQPGGLYFLGYKDAELERLFDRFIDCLDELGLQHEQAVILARGADRVAKLSGEVEPPGRGAMTAFTEAALLRDQHARFLDAFKLVSRGVVSLLEDAPSGLASKLLGAPQEEWMLRLRRVLWGFTRDADAGLPSSNLLGESEWHPLLLQRIRSLLVYIQRDYGFASVANLGNKLSKRDLGNAPLNAASPVGKQGPEIRVETVHQVKGESIDAVLYVAKKAHIEALLGGTGDEEGRIGYVAVTRARNLFWLAVPNSCLKELRPKLISAGFGELTNG